MKHSMAAFAEPEIISDVMLASRSAADVMHV
jgi:hypothetical protein